MPTIIDKLDNFFSPKYQWDFYKIINWTEKKIVTTKVMTERQAIKYSQENSLLYSFNDI